MSDRKLRIPEQAHGREGIADYRTREEGERRTRPVEARAFTDAPKDLSMRSISAAVYAIAVIGCLFAGKLPTAFLCSAMAFMCYYEFNGLVRGYDCDPSLIVGGIGAIIFPIVEFLPGDWMVPALFLFFIAAAAWYLCTAEADLVDVSVTVFGAIYTGVMFSSLVAIRSALDGIPGALLSLGVLGSIWLNDVAAYYLGTMFGEHKMAPSISPNKSWEGFAAGLLTCVLVWVCLSVSGVCAIPVPQAVATGVVVGLAGVAGDLFESKIKRGVGAKDSGNLMPGHGGMLDRSDAILFACIAARTMLHIWGVL